MSANKLDSRELYHFVPSRVQESVHGSIKVSPEKPPAEEAL